ncbi:MAG: DegT/DnrJ/EryC1/StrS family aminotransferase [bacterium]
MQIKYIDLQQQYRDLRSEIDTAIAVVLDTSAYVLGPAVRNFEENYAEFCGVRHCLGVSSGTDALVLALRALQVGPEDEVITVANSFVATAAAIAQTGARPVLVDIDPAGRNIDPSLIEAAITNNTKGIIPVHLYGRPADMDQIDRIASKHGLFVLEDAAQAQGANYKGRRAGSLGIMAAFSFYPAKNLGAFGEAGAVTTNDDNLAHRVRMLRDHGSEKKYVHDMLGYNARMDGIQGAVLGVKLKHLDRFNARRRAIARIYNQALAELPLRLPADVTDGEQVYHVYAIETPSRDDLRAYLAEEGVPTIIHYPIPIHLQKAFAYLGYSRGSFPHAECSAASTLSLPIYPEMTNPQVDYVAAKVKSFFD